MTILLTGSHGFVGTNLIEAFESKYLIIRWDARKDEPLVECDAVIHLASLAHDVKKSEGRWKKEDYFRVNTEMTKKIFERFLESSAKKFIFFSSIKAQDNDTPYANSKKQAEDYILNRLNEIHETSGTSEQSSKPHQERNETEKKIYILRPCMIHGRGNKGNLNLLVKWVKKGLPWPLASFENKRCFASMENVAYVVSELLKKDVESGIYNICDDEPVSTNELIELICESIGKKARLWRIPKRMMKVIAKVGDTIQLPLNTERLGKLTENYIIDNNDVKHALRVERMPIGAREGLQRTILSMINDIGK